MSQSWARHWLPGSWSCDHRETVMAVSTRSSCKSEWLLNTNEGELLTEQVVAKHGPSILKSANGQMHHHKQFSQEKAREHGDLLPHTYSWGLPLFHKWPSFPMNTTWIFRWIPSWESSGLILHTIVTAGWMAFNRASKIPHWRLWNPLNYWMVIVCTYSLEHLQPSPVTSFFAHFYF